MITCQPVWRWMRRLLQLGCLGLMSATPAGAQTLSTHGRASEPLALAVLGAGFFALGFIRRRYSGD